MTPGAAARAGRLEGEIVVDSRSRGAEILRAAAHPAVIAAVAVAILALRVSDKLISPGLIAEEALLREHGVLQSGFIQLLPWLAVSFPPPIPLLAHIATIALIVGALVQLRVPAAAALGLALLPMGERIYSTVLDAHFSMAIYLAVLAIRSPSLWHIIPAGFAALNGGDALLLVPVYAVTFARHRALSAVVLAGAALQLAAALVGERQLASSTDIVATTVSAVERVGLAPIGQDWALVLFGTSVGLAVAALTIASALAAARHTERQLLLVLGYMSAATLGAGLLAGTDLASFATGERYLVAGAWTLWLLAIGAFPRPSSWLLLALFAIGMSMNFATQPEAYPRI